METSKNLRLLHNIALFILVISALASVYFTIEAGSHNKSVLLRLFFLMWVISPFAGMIIVDRFSRARTISGTYILSIAMLVLGAIPTLAYGGLFGSFGNKPAFVFLVVPFISWIFILIVIITKKLASKSLNP